MKLRIPSIGGALLLASAAGLALAAPSFGDLDKNKDGYISQTEAKGDSSVMAGFAGADKNRDGKLDPAEFAAIPRSN
ncbi:MAG: hypothetical protein WCE38_14575 [Burkholderiales bacterium]